MSAVSGVEADLVESGQELPSARSRGLRTWILRRAVIGLVSLIAISVIVFLATQALPGNAAAQILGHSGNPKRIAALSHQLGLDKPLATQYWDWARGIVTGDLGTSLDSGQSVGELIAEPLVNSLILLVSAAVLIAGISVLAGVLAAAFRDRLIDNAFSLYSYLFTAVPEFVVALTLVIVFGTTVFAVLPAVSTIPPGASPFEHLESFVLPVATLVLVCVPYLGRLFRGSMIEALDSEYARYARYKGVSKAGVLFRHALPNALVPGFQGFSVIIGYLAGGVVVVEFAFGFPGIGTVLIQAIKGRDIPVIQAVTLFLASVYVIANLVTDILVVLITPRLRTAGR